MSNKAPKKLYLENFDLRTIKESEWKHDCSIWQTPPNEHFTPYILESEHDRIVSELKEELPLKIDVEIEDLELRIHRLELAIHDEMSYPNPQPENYDNLEGWIHERMVCKEKLQLLKSIK